MRKWDFLTNRIEKYKFSYTPTQSFIAETILKNPEIVLLPTIKDIAERTNTSINSVYLFIKVIGLENIFQFKTFIKNGLKGETTNILLAKTITNTIDKMDSFDWTSILRDINSATQLVVCSKGQTKFIAGSLARKISKMGFSVLEVIGSDNWDMFINTKEKLFFIYITISGKHADIIPTNLKPYFKKYSSIIISHAQPHYTLLKLFSYSIYAQYMFDFPKSEFESPRDTELLTMLVINEFVKKL